MAKNTMSIGERSTASGLSTHALRYYEKLGVLKPADRAASGHRQYRADAVAWLDFVLRLQITGMPLAGGFVVPRIPSMRLSGRRCQRRSSELRFDREIDQVTNAHRRTRSRHAIGDAKI